MDERIELAKLAAVLYPSIKATGHPVDESMRQAVESAALLLEFTDRFLAASPEAQTNRTWAKPPAQTLLSPRRDTARMENPLGQLANGGQG